MEWNEDTNRELGTIGGTLQTKVKRLLASAVNKRREAIQLQALATKMISEANDQAREAFLLSDIRSVKTLVGETLTMKVNSPRHTLNRKKLQYNLLDFMDAKQIERVIKKSTDISQPKEPESIAYSAGKEG